jgi:hypothetical protein
VGEWGFRYYMGQLGILPMPADKSLISGGSFIAVPELALPHDLPADLRSMMMPVETLRYRPETNIRVFDTQTPAGFYSSGWGLIPFSFSSKTLEQIEVYQVSFMVERLPWATIETSAEIKPWPGYLELQGQTHLAILAKTGSRITYEQSIPKRTKLKLLCGVSPDSYKEGSEDSFRFEIRRLDAEGRVLEESHVTVQPGINPEDRDWQSVQMVLEAGEDHLLDFGYFGTVNDSGGVGAFAQAILVPAVEYENIKAME